MNVLDLFSGVGGFSLGLERAGFQTTAFCEIDPYCRKVLARHWPDVTIHDDIRKLDGTQYAGTVDVVCGGYPCQPFSTAGKQQGEEDARHLWPEMRRIIRQARPRWVVAENVRGHVGLGFDTVAAQMEDDGFTVWPFIVPACAVGAPHRRDRLWILAHNPSDGRGTRRTRGSYPSCQGESEQALPSLANADCERKPQPEGTVREIGRRISDSGEDVADTTCERAQGMRTTGEQQSPALAGEALPSRPCAGEGAGHWSVEPPVGRLVNGIPHRVDRLRAAGNAVVPQIVEQIGRTIIAYESSL